MSLSKPKTSPSPGQPHLYSGWVGMERRSAVAPLRDTDTLNPITTQQGYSSDSPLANMIHASLKTSNLPKPRNMPATKLGNVCGSICSKYRPSAV